MDNARWIVVLSVIVSMMVTLTLLNRYARQQPTDVPKAVEQVTKVSAPRVSEVPRPEAGLSSQNEIPNYSKISFPRPAAHTLTVDQPKDFEKMKESIKVEGNIIR
ncbi:MAG: hypothetical protein CVV42_17745 [Candidatus Riflebacteria bacterium HGW-Riflebacteria-2]|jgi:hypothetical protein|nr:MAG: hypothetical protein CVV42_17745 [Candidatus Riflebacteria bacterium HGW-Riflebacteria-2]